MEPTPSVASIALDEPEADASLDVSELLTAPDDVEGEPFVIKALAAGLETKCAVHEAEIGPKLETPPTPTWSSRRVVRESRQTWIPSPRSLNVLLQPLPLPERRLSYTMPGLCSDELIEDPLNELSQKHLGRVLKRSTSHPEQSVTGVDDLMKRGEFRSAANLCAALLTACGQGFGKAHTHSRNNPESLELWRKRLQLLVAMKRVDLANAEMETFGDLEAPDLYFQYYPETYRGVRGSMVPFSLRLLHAELPIHTGNYREALGRATHIVSTIQQMLTNLNQGLAEDGSGCLESADAATAAAVWKKRLADGQHSLARILFSMKDYKLALEVYERLAAESEGDARALTLSAMGRLGLSLGHYPAAAAAFQRFNTVCDQTSTKMKTLACLHKGFLSLFYGGYSEALEAFQAALRYEPRNPDATNNAAACLLYLGNLAEAVALLENALNDGVLTESSCLNLATLYELATAQNTGKKSSLLQAVAARNNDFFAVESLKL